MSYVLTAYLVDLADLKSMMGSKDRSIIQDVESIISEVYEDDEEEIDPQNAAVRALVMGERLHPENSDAYASALWHICKVKGEELPPDAWGGVRWDSIEVCGLEDLLTKTGPPVKLPPHQDIPYVGHIKHSDVDPYLQTAEEKAADTDDDGVRGLLEEYIAWLEEAKSREKDIVFFYG
jgi:hypothetical protein